MKPLIELILELDEDALARVWVDLNRWEWPRDFPDERKPRWWRTDMNFPSPQKSFQRRFGFVDVFHPYIETQISEEKIQEERDRATDPLKREEE